MRSNPQSYEFLQRTAGFKADALLQKKKIDALLQKDFKEDANVNELISRLLKARKVVHLWGWWPEGTPLPGFPCMSRMPC